jgi:hypothetical protein
MRETTPASSVHCGHKPTKVQRLLEGFQPLRPRILKRRKHNMNETEKRKYWLKIRVSEEEKSAIETKFQNSGFKSKSEFIRAMIFQGLIVKIDKEITKDFMRKLNSIANNVNQIALRVNSTGNLYENDLAELKEGVTDIRHQHFRFLSLLHNARTTGISSLIEEKKGEK